MSPRESGSFTVFTINQVCEQLGISRSLCYREIRSGNLRAHRFARRAYRVSPEDLADYIARSVEPSPPSKPVPTPRHRAKHEHSHFRHIDVSRWLSSQS
jgi:excisionase family DNA binding protein